MSEKKVTRRKQPPKRRSIKPERRKDMQIIASASQTDIYVWALSLAVMVGILAVFVVSALTLGGGK